MKTYIFITNNSSAEWKREYEKLYKKYFKRVKANPKVAIELIDSEPHPKKKGYSRVVIMGRGYNVIPTQHIKKSLPRGYTSRRAPVPRDLFKNIMLYL